MCVWERGREKQKRERSDAYGEGGEGSGDLFMFTISVQLRILLITKERMLEKRGGEEEMKERRGACIEDLLASY